MKLSACIITKNEEKNIARSILSYKDIVDEIIVVDSESTDDTVKIAESLGAKVFTRSWTNDFAAAKNYAIDRASGDWIIFLDADEYFASSHADRVLKLIEEAAGKGGESIFSSMLEIEKNIEKPSGIYYTERIFKNHPKIRYINPIHEYLHHDGRALRRFQTDEIVIYHTGYNPHVIRDKIRRNITILQDPATVLTSEYRKHMYLAENYYALGMHEETIHECDKVMSYPAFREIIFTTGKTCKVYVYKIAAMLGLSDEYQEEDIRTLVDEAVGNFKNHPEIKYMQYSFFRHYNRIDAALEALHEAILLNEIYHDPYENMFGSNMDIKYAQVAELYKIKHDIVCALTFFSKSLSINKENEGILIELLLILREGDPGQAEEIIESIYDTNDPKDNQKIVQAAWLAGNNHLFTKYLLQLLQEQPPEFAQDQNLLCKILLLQKNYSDVLELTRQMPDGGMREKFAFIAKLISGHEDVYNCKVDDAFIFPVISELLQSGENEALARLLDDPGRFGWPALNEPEKKAALGGILERYARFEQAKKYYLEAANDFDENGLKRKHFVLAAKAAYYIGEYGEGLKILDESADVADSRDDHLGEEVRKWIKSRS